MKNSRILLLIAALCLNGCATVKTLAESPDTFAVCKTADVVTTAYALRTGFFVEKNPFVSAIISHGYFPLIAVSVGLWYAIDRYNNKNVTMAANAITCPVAAHNMLLLLK